MKLLIDIPEHIYEHAKETTEDSRDEFDAMRAIANGSRQRTGRWIAQDIHNCHTNFKCSDCGYIHNFMHLYGEPTADYTYCPNCGAKMEVTT